MTIYQLLTVIENSDQKQLTLAQNRNNKMYIENTKIHIKITMPFLLEISNGNSS
jgi:hypothetical protein